ncbi:MULTISPECIES: EamA family transporter [Dyadobacter]|uniref:EamA family transporter n=1 Tax=Dyadobacter chenhuakuii TaxID=2909339 RepID=A0A9X1QI26_9BACT|nr:MULTISPECIES: EamA family transporter [Dyadobacter]MCF2493615.1 EamA family transporter [Dyadobacter chenhuakuii]MCF2500877.1 EamA family transporter [Dyadobacter chenhuakuii]MCF2517862.1 EamA family transporter [Dyadobacter sp. CY351]USJ30752.1 EamA family transporter [Dyadobacter chenhuakuii]
MKFSKHYLAAFISFVIWGFFSLALKPLKAYASLDILFYRVFLCAVIMAVISLFVRVKVLKENVKTFRQMPSEQRKRVTLLTLAGGILLTANWFFFIYVMNHISVKAASFAYLVCPIMTTVIAYFVLNEKLSKWQWAAVSLSIVSCMLLSFSNVADIAYSLIVALSYAFYLVSQRKNVGMDKFLVLTVQIIFSALILLPFYPQYSEALPTEFSFYALIFVIAVLFTIVPLYMNLYALQSVTSSTMGILLYINPLMNFFIALVYFHEPINSIQITAYSLILLSIVVFNERFIFGRRRAALG